MVLYGVSDSANESLLVASYLPHLADAVVANSPPPPSTSSPAAPPGLYIGGKPLADGMTIPVTSIRIPLLMGDGGQDGLQDSAGSATFIMSELHGSADHAPATNLYYPGAGHAYFGLPPYYPFFTELLLALVFHEAWLLSGAPKRKNAPELG